MIFLDGFTSVLVYACLLSVGIMISGIYWPRNLFDYTSALYRQRNWEKSNKVYGFLKVSKWKGRVPDMSKIVGKMPDKRISCLNVDTLNMMIKETCVAEFAHILLIIFAIPMNFMWDGIYGFVCFLMYSIGNIPFIIIQRYNRPRLIKVLERLENRQCES